MRKTELIRYVQTRLRNLLGNELGGITPMIEQLADMSYDLCPTVSGTAPVKVGTIIIQAVTTWKSKSVPEAALDEFFQLTNEAEETMLKAGHRLNKIQKIRLFVERRR